MKEFLGKYVYIEIQKPSKVMIHKCALVKEVTNTHISIFDTFNDEPYCYRIIDIVEIKLSNKFHEEVKDG